MPSRMHEYGKNSIDFNVASLEYTPTNKAVAIA